MPNQQRVPTSDEATSPAGGWTTAPMWSKVDETTPNDADYLVGVTYSAPCYQTFGFAVFSVPAGATIQDLTIYYRAARIASATANIRASLKVGGTYYPTTDAGVNPPQTPTITTYSRVFTTNPKSGVAWTPDDINGVGTNALQAFGVSSSDLTPDVNVYMVYAQVNYTMPSVDLAGVMSGSGLMAGALTPERNLVGILSGTGLMAGALSLTLSLTGAMSGTGLMAAPLSLTKFLSGSMDGTGLMTAVLTPERNLAGLASGIGNAVADIDVTAGGGAVVTLEGLLAGSGLALAPLTKPSGTPPWANSVHAITYNLTFANTNLRDQMKNNVDNWLVGKEEWGTGEDAKRHTQSENDDNLIVRLVSQNDMDALLSFVESKCESTPVLSGRVAKHWCGHRNYNSCQEIEVLNY